ncbi:MAG TPA: xanthine dehydrogenase family protein molybdopterin-binding subunit [Usitatibacter sp.]|jgi:isoquinoline 1-oxidoreductase beta subunit|nr:xanthine dehydrogenase family protein molybdopterin-binding subunit [Usitatibacter sp.]
MANVTRRQFLKSSTAMTGGLVIAFWLPAGRQVRAQVPAPSAPSPNAFLRIGKDGTCTVMVKHLEFGQGVTTSLPMLVAEELECDWTKVRAELAPAGAEYAHTVFGVQMTGGSTSVFNSYDQLRTVGAQARTMLMQAAANQWKVRPSEVRAEKGFVIGPGGKKLSYGQLAEAAGKLPVPEKVELKDRKDFKVIGKPTRRLDSSEKVTGAAQFGIDVKRPNLHTAVVLHPPVFGAKVASLNAEKVKSVAGVTHVVEIRNGVAVVARNFWAAKQGRDALQVEWDLGPNATVSTEALRKQFRDLAQTPGKSAKKSGDPAAIPSAAKKIVGEYEVPFLAHAPMEPLNCTIELRADGAEIWVGSQFQGVDLPAAAQELGLDPSKVKLNTMLAGGGFGRRANPTSDYVVEACEVARRAKVPVKVVWTREDDIRGGYYRPMYVHRVEAALDPAGALIGWKHVVVGPSILGGTPFEPMMITEGIDPTSVEGIVERPIPIPNMKIESEGMPYHVPNMDVTLHTVPTGIPVLWWRSVGFSHNGFVVETMIDEIAAAAGKDPVEYRRTLLARNPRALKVLETAASKAGWGTPLPKGRARGVALVNSFFSVCAQVAEVSLEGGAPRVHRIVAAFDCGLVVNPMTVEAQVQGAIAFGLSAALHGKITLKDGRVEQSNFHDYPVLRMKEMPRVEVHLVGGGDAPTGVGEVGVPPVAPAVCNALAALTGKRVRVLPLDDMKWT